MRKDNPGNIEFSYIKKDVLFIGAYSSMKRAYLFKVPLQRDYFLYERELIIILWCLEWSQQPIDIDCSSKSFSFSCKGYEKVSFECGGDVFNLSCIKENGENTGSLGELFSIAKTLTGIKG